MTCWQIIDYARFVEFSDEFYFANTEIGLLAVDAWWGLGYI